MNKAVFLDRDGVINVEVDYVYKIEDFIFIEKTFEALKIIQDKGYQIVMCAKKSQKSTTRLPKRAKNLPNRGYNITAILKFQPNSLVGNFYYKKACFTGLFCF